MNFNYIIVTLMSLLFDQESYGYDPIKDFEVIIESPQLTASVLEYFKNEIQNKIMDIHKNSKKITIDIQEDSYSISKDNEVLYQETSFKKQFSIDRSLLSMFKDLKLTNEVFFLIKIGEKVSYKMKKELEDAVDYLLTVGKSSLFIFELNDSEIFDFQNNKRLNTCIQYFYNFEEIPYCAYIKDYKAPDSFYFSYNTMLYYFIKRVLNIKSDKKFIDSILNSNHASVCNEGFKNYNDFILFHVAKKMSFPEDFLMKNFLKKNYNDFFESLFLLKKSKVLNRIAKNYFEKLPDDQILSIAKKSCKLLICIPIRHNGSCFCGKNSKIDIEDIIQYDLEKESIILEASEVSVLQSFFEFLLTNYKEEIMKYKDEFLLIMFREMLKTLEILFSDFKKRSKTF